VRDKKTLSKVLFTDTVDDVSSMPSVTLGKGRICRVFLGLCPGKATVSRSVFAVLSVSQVQKEKEQFIYLRPLTINNRREHLKRWIIVMAFIIIHHGELDMQQRI